MRLLTGAGWHRRSLSWRRDCPWQSIPWQAPPRETMRRDTGPPLASRNAAHQSNTNLNASIAGIAIMPAVPCPPGNATTRSGLSMIPPDGGSRKSLPAGVGLECHKRVDGFRDVYGRGNFACRCVALSRQQSTRPRSSIGKSGLSLIQHQPRNAPHYRLRQAPEIKPFRTVLNPRSPEVRRKTGHSEKNRPFALFRGAEPK